MESGHVFAHVGHVQSVVLDCQATSVVQNSPARVHAENQMSYHSAGGLINKVKVIRSLHVEK